jgi:predicted anti-sigma-YlaC factor YlaD
MTSRPLSLNDCESIVRRLWPFLDGKLAEIDRGIIVAHLADCVNCRSHFDFARAFLEAVHKVRPPAAASDRLQARVLAALLEHGYTPGGA